MYFLRVAVRNKFKKLTVGWVLLYVFMIAMVAFTAIPLIYVINTAFKPLNELLLFPPRYFVINPTLKNFADLVMALSSSSVPFLRYVFNSLLVSSLVVFFTIIVASLGSYGMVIHRPKGSVVLMQIIIASLMFGTHVTQIARFVIIEGLNLIDTYTALILPNIAGSYGFFLMKQFTEQFPIELVEAARIDGARELRIYWKILMPSLAPAWATLTVFTFVSTWNDYFTPLVFTTSAAMKTLPLMLSLMGTNIARAGAVAASSFLMTMPSVIIFTLMQSKVMETLTHSGIKG